MHTPRPGRTKDMEKKRSYSRSKHTSQQEIALYIFGKKTKKCNPLSLRYLQQLGFLAGHSSVQGCWSRLLAQNESKAQLFPEVSTSFWNTGPQPQRARGQGPACTLCSEPCRLQPAGGQDRMEGPSPETPSLGRSVGLSHTLLGGAATCSQGIHQPILHIHIRCACGDLTRTTHERVFKCLYELNQLTSNINKM